MMSGFLQIFKKPYSRLLAHCLNNPIENLAVSREIQPQWPPVFIVGAPRSGSTLFYQALTNRYKVCYINNLTAHLYHAVYIASLISRIRFGNYPHNTFTSCHGKTNGANAPSECGQFWYRWFPENPVYSPAGTLSSESLTELRANVALIMQAWKLPLVFKNLYCALRMGTLKEVFPDALFIHCRRDPFYCAHSVLMTRKRVHGDMNAWWSLKPKEYDKIKNHHCIEQVVEQQYYINRQISEDIELFGRSHMFTVHYKEFCSNPKSVLLRVHEWLANVGIALEVRAEIPQQFSRKTISDSTHVDLAELKSAVQRVFPEWTEPSELQNASWNSHENP